MVEWVLQSFSQGQRSLDEHLAAVERGESFQERFVSAWSTLAPRSRTVLSACAFLEGSAVAEQLGVACGFDQDLLSAALGDLIGVGLVVPVNSTDRPTTYTCSQRVARFALLKTASMTLDEFTDRLVHRLREHFAQNPEDAPAAIPHLGPLRAVMARLAEEGNDDDLQALFRASLDILFTLGYFDDRISLGLLAYESAVAADNHTSAALAAEVLSSTYAARGEIVAARRALAWGELAAERSGVAADKARQMRCAGLVSFRSGEAQQALIDIEGADQLARGAEDFECVVNILGVRAAASRHVGALDESQAAAEEELRICERMVWFRGISYPLKDLAEIAIHRGSFAEARKYLERARSISVESEDKRQLARVSLTQARLCLLEGRLTAAREAAAGAQSEAARLGLSPEATEARAIYEAARRARLLPLLRLYYRRARPLRLTDAPV